LPEQISEERGTICWLPNFALSHCARRIRDSQLSALDLSSLRLAIDCSEPVTPGAIDRFYEKFAPYGLRRAALSSSYAMAETTFAVTQSTVGASARRIHVLRSRLASEGLAVEAPAEEESDEITQLVSSGRVLPRTQVEIVDEHGATLPDGRVGEIRIRSDWLMEGYFKAPAATGAAVRDGWYHSGDLGLLLRGELYVTGRAKDVLIVAGQNVYPHELEDCISGISGIKAGRVVVFGVFDEDEGTERAVVLAETSTTQQSAQDIDELRLEIRNVIFDRFGVALSDVEISSERVLLKSTSGKLSRSRNRESYLARTSAPGALPARSSSPA
jgi:acyl-CoA synthetase (AMP-forming)/AMP-acid ligase II